MLWRRTWDSNPRGCYTLLDFQSSSLAARSILQKYLVISDAHLYYHRNRVNASTFLIFSNYSEAVEKTGPGRSGFSTFCKASQASHVILNILEQLEDGHLCRIRHALEHAHRFQVVDIALGQLGLLPYIIQRSKRRSVVSICQGFCRRFA